MLNRKNTVLIVVPFIIIISTVLFWTSCSTSPNLISAELPVKGEYRIEEPGADYTGSGLTGIIDGKEYLFLEINTLNSNTPVSPGILVLDITDKTSPEKAAYIDTGDNSSFIRSTALQGTVLYVSAGSYLRVIDVSDPNNPREISKVEGLSTNQMVISGDYAFTTYGNFGITTLDLSDPENPVEAGYLHLQTQSGIQMVLHDNLMYAKDSTHLFIIDTSVPPELKIVNEMTFSAPADDENPDIIYPCYTMRMAIEDEIAYMVLSVEKRMLVSVLDISEPVEPKETGLIRVKDRQFTGPVFIAGDKFYIFTMKYPDLWAEIRLDILDISKPDTPVAAGFGTLPDASNFFENYYGGYYQKYRVCDNYLYWFIGDPPNPPVIEILELPE